MMKWSALGAGGRALVGVGVAGVIGVSGYLIKQAGMTPAPTIIETAAPVAPAAADQAVKTTSPEPSTQVVLPSFDLVRIDAQGNTTVAGNAAPLQTLSLRVDGAEIAQTVADTQGKFAALFTLAPSPNPRLLTLVAIGPNGQEVLAANSVAISPFAEPAPEVMATIDATPAAVAEAPIALVIGDEGVEVIVNDQDTVQPADASAPQGVTIAAITYSASGAVLLSGTGAASAPLRLYLDQAVVAETAVQSDGAWSVELADVAPGIYTLRVDQLNADGQVDARFETPFKRETPETLAAATTGPVPAAEVASAVAPVSAEGNVVVAAKTATEDVKTTEDTASPQAPKATEAAVVTDAVAPETLAKVTPVTPSAPVTITVQPGFTLWRIAQEQLGEGIMYVQVFKANQGNIADPDLIYPGQIFTIPTPKE